MFIITDERLAELRRSAPPPHEPQRLPFDTFNSLTPELINYLQKQIWL